MKTRNLRAMIVWTFTLLLAWNVSGLYAQKVVLPLGDSITLGKSNNLDPTQNDADPTSHGYRGYLKTILGADIEFTGPATGDPVIVGTAAYPGWFKDGSKISAFLSGGDMYAINMLNGLAVSDRPDFILVHLGTNDVGELGETENPNIIGHYNTSGTILYNMKVLMHNLLDWNGGSVEQIFLSRIIPKAPISEFPGVNANIQDYNRGLEKLYTEDLEVLYPGRVTLVDMYSPFYANQPIYYTADTNPATSDDHVHPALAGYAAMGNQWADYLIDYMTPNPIDQFLYANGSSINGVNGWHSSSSNALMINEPDPSGETPGGALYCNSQDMTWSHAAVWDQSLGMNSISFRIHGSSDNNTTFTSAVGVLVGMNGNNLADATVSNRPGGYMVFVHSDGSVQAYVYDGSRGSNPIGAKVGDATLEALSPRDVLTVTYENESNKNTLFISKNGGNGVPIKPTIQLLSTGVDYYSGVIFRGITGGLQNLMLDYVEMDNQRVDLIPPAQVDLTVLGPAATNSTITLTWTAPSDDGDGTGASPASYYDLRYSMDPITSDVDFDKAAIVGGLEPPSDPGVEETVPITGLLSGATYYFAIKAVDDFGNASDLSTAVSGATTTERTSVDMFTDLDKWKLDPAEYRVDAGSGELENALDLSGADRDGSIAVYKAVKNPNMVKMVWGGSVTNNITGSPDEAENGGILMMASDTSLQASGYFIFIRTKYNQVYLFETNWDSGINDRSYTLLDAASYDITRLGSAPDANDTLAVVLDNSEDTYTKFDVYVGLNGNSMKNATRVSLYDTRQAALRQGQSEPYYSGLMLYRYQNTANRNNRVKAFLTTSPQTGIAGLAALSPLTGNTAVVNTELADSVRVRVEDQNGLPIANVPVYFRVASGGGEISTPYLPDNRIRLEAEWGNPTYPFLVYNDNTASGGKYVTSLQRGGTIRGTATYTFNVDEAGTYYYWARVKNVNLATRFALGFELVGQDPSGGIIWSVLEGESLTGNWQWDVINEQYSSAPHSHYLTPGMYTLRITSAHEEIYVDKFVITRDLPTIWQPLGLEEEDIKLSDANGEAAVAWTLGTVADDLGSTGSNEGLNELEVWSFGNTQSMIFEATGLAGEAASLTDVSGNLQSNSGDTVDVQIQVFDQYNNKKQGQAVTFDVIQGDGTLLAGHDTRTTDESGVALARMILGAEDSVTVKAYYSASGPSVNVKAYVIQGAIGSLTSMTSNRNLHVDSTYAGYLRVLVRDLNGDPVTTTTPVQFIVRDNLGTLINGATSSTVWTDINGQAAATLNTGTMAGIIDIIARTSGQEITVAQDSVFYTAVHVSRPAGSGGQEVLTPGALSFYPVKVYVSDRDWNPVKNHPVRFTITDESSGFTFENTGATVVERLTDNLGFASVRVKAGMLHGRAEDYENIVVASSDDGFGGAIETPQYFTFYVKSNAYKLLKLSDLPTDTTGVVSEMIGPLKVKLVKADGSALGNQEITFERVSGNGSFNPETQLAKKVVMADATGFASTNFWLGTFAGPDSNKVRVYTENYDLIIETDYNCLAQSSIGDTLFSTESRQISGAVASTYTVTVKVQDQGGNPVENEDVIFSILKGDNATVGSGGADTSRTVTTDKWGSASVQWTLGTTAGAASDILTARAHNGNYTLKGSPVQFTGNTSAGAVSLLRSELTATSPIMVGEDEKCDITVTLYDKYGNPVNGQSVEMVVLGGSNNFPSKQNRTTDASGVALGQLQSTVAGERTIKAVVGGDTLNASASVIFLAGNAAQLVLDAGNDQTGNINTVLADAFSVRVTDSDGNPVQYGPVYFNVYGDVGAMVEAQPVITDVNGYARAHFKLGSTVGRYAAVQVTSPNLANQPSFWVIGTNNPAYSMWYPEGYDSELEGIAGQPSPPLICQVIDADGRPVANENVTFTVNPDENSNGAIIGDKTVKSDEYGHATVNFRMDTRSGFESWIYAENAKQTGKVWFKATSVSGQALNITAVGSTSLSGQVIGTNIQLAVKVTDDYANPIEGVAVNWQRLLGDADILGSGSVISNSNGESVITLSLGNLAGPVRVQASAPLEGSPVVFNIETQTSEQNASNLIKLGTGVNKMHATVSRYLADSLYTRVVDDYGNPVANQPVLFRILGSLNGSFISGDGREYSDANGVAAVAFKCGTMPDYLHQIEARWGNKTVVFEVQTHNNASFPVLDKDYISSIYTGVEEGSDLWIELRGSDADGDNISFEIGGVLPPAGAYIEQSATPGRATFKWSPDYTQGRSEAYDLILRVKDDRGGYDQKAIKVFVQNLNQLPEIEAIVPDHNDVTTAGGQTVVFEVHVVDPDGDPLVYSWLVDNVQISNNSAVYHHKAPAGVTTTQIIDVLVSDGPFTVTQRWTLNVTNAVQMAAVASDVMTSDGSVRLMWRTTVETENAGFDVMRSNHAEGPYQQVNQSLVAASTDGQYIFIDHSVQAGYTYYYKLVDRDNSGAGQEHGPYKVTVNAPERFTLQQNYPNPFNPSTTIRYELPQAGLVKLTIYNMMGQPVKELVNQIMPAGYHSLEWDGTDSRGVGTATGLYLYRLEFGDKVMVKRMIKLH